MIRVLEGDCRAVLPTLADASVHTVVTSPPYYGLRDYGAAGQLGLEASPAEYIATMVSIFREVRRVLRDDGTCWVNMGDAYASSVNGRSAADTKAAGNDDRTFRDKPFSTVGNGYKPKDLLMMPARLAIALQADGWWLRSDIIWAKPNPMPESVRDRPTNAHEHVFLLTKAPRYFYDADAVREPHADKAGGIERFGNIGSRGGHQGGDYGDPLVRPDLAKAPGGRIYNPAGRSCRNVWTIATAPFPEAHFATFPPALAERCIKAGTSERGCCAQCGKPWVRQTERSVAYTSGSGRAGNVPQGKYHGTEQALSGSYDIRMGPSVSSITTGWLPACKCGASTKPCTVLDPFAGAGTTGLVADRLQRDAIMIELNPAYATMMRNRLTRDAPLFAEVAD